MLDWIRRLQFHRASENVAEEKWASSSVCIKLAPSLRGRPALFVHLNLQSAMRRGISETRLSAIRLATRSKSSGHTRPRAPLHSQHSASRRMRCAPAAAAYSDATELDLDFSLQGRRRRSCRRAVPSNLPSSFVFLLPLLV